MTIGQRIREWRIRFGMWLLKPDLPVGITIINGIDCTIAVVRCEDVETFDHHFTVRPVLHRAHHDRTVH